MGDNHHYDRPAGYNSHRPDPPMHPRTNGELANAKLDLLLTKISNQLSAMKKHKRNPLG